MPAKFVKMAETNTTKPLLQGTEIRVPPGIIPLTQELMEAIHQLANVNYMAGYRAGYEQRKSEEAHNGTTKLVD